MAKCPRCNAPYDDEYYQKKGICSNCGAKFTESIDKQNATARKQAVMAAQSANSTTTKRYQKIDKNYVTRRTQELEKKKSIVEKDADTNIITKPSAETNNIASTTFSSGINNEDEMDSSDINEPVFEMDFYDEDDDIQIHDDTTLPESNTSMLDVAATPIPYEDISETVDDSIYQDINPNMQVSEDGDIFFFDDEDEDFDSATAHQLSISCDEADSLADESNDESDLTEPLTLDSATFLNNKPVNSETDDSDSSSNPPQEDSVKKSCAEMLKDYLEKEHNKKKEQLEFPEMKLNFNEDGYYNDTPLFEPNKEDSITTKTVLRVVLFIAGLFCAIIFLTWYA